MSRNVHWRPHESSKSTNASRSDSERGSYDTYDTYDTAPTESSSRRPSLAQHSTCNGRVQGHARDGDSYVSPPADARASVDTYASTSDEHVDECEGDREPDYHVPQYLHEPLPVDAIATTPRDFADLFPTAKRLSIRHDDSTIDGNMNLRVDTQLESRHAGPHSPHKLNYTLFHLRMHDLRTRDFSLRRYCRDSGREVCHSLRKYQTPPPDKRPVLQRASTALASLVHKPDSRPSTARPLKRSDSGYESMRGPAPHRDRDDARDDAADDDDADDCHGPRSSKTAGYAKGRALMPTNTLKLEFSNYAHLDLKRRGAKSSKRYAFEYWGHDYAWKRIVQRQRDHESVTYYLVRSDNERHALAHISPVNMSTSQAHEEAARGGWIPPCYMRITDDGVLNASTDIADIVVATGLMTLVDDCIKRKFHSKQSTQLHIPLLRAGSFKMNMEYIGPRRLIDEVFHRRNPSSGRAPAVRQHTM